MRYLSLLTALLAFCHGCGESLSYRQVSVALGDVPEEVELISVSVFRADSQSFVTSATISAPATRLALGVPAERPLEFRIVARTNRPGPQSIGGTMPAYANRVLRTIPLGSEPAQVRLAVQPAGVLTVTLPPGPQLVSQRTQLVLEPTSGNHPPVLLWVENTRVRNSFSVVLPQGYYQADVREKDKDELLVPSGKGIYVGAQLHSLAELELTNYEETRPGQAVEIQLVHTSSTPGLVLTSTVPLSQQVSLEALVSPGAELREQPEEVELQFNAEPQDLLLELPLPPTELPGEISPLLFEEDAQGRLEIVASARWGERVLSGQLHLEVRPQALVPEKETQLRLNIGRLRALEKRGTLTVELRDQDGLLATEAVGEIDLSQSDPFIYFEGPSLTELSTASLGRLQVPFRYPSAPEGLPVVLRARYRSTIDQRVLTSTLTLGAKL